MHIFEDREEVNRLNADVLVDDEGDTYVKVRSIKFHSKEKQKQAVETKPTTSDFKNPPRGLSPGASSKF